MSNEIELHSELGCELLQLQKTSVTKSIDPSNVKDILVFAEDTRISIRKSEMESLKKEELPEMQMHLSVQPSNGHFLGTQYIGFH